MPEKTEVTLIAEVIKCPRLKSYITYQECKACENHRGRVVVMTNPDLLRPIEDIRCVFPAGRRIEAFVEENKDKREVI